MRSAAIPKKKKKLYYSEQVRGENQGGPSGKEKAIWRGLYASLIAHLVGVRLSIF